MARWLHLAHPVGPQHFQSTLDVSPTTVSRRLVAIGRRRIAWLKLLLAGTLVFNLLDLVLTLAVVSAGLAVEANPLMALLLEWGGEVPFAVGKLALVSGGVWVLWRHRRKGLALAGGMCTCAAYAAVCLYHVRSVHAMAGWVAAQ